MLDPSRQSGDTGVIESDYGAHVMYFVGYDIPYWQVQVRDDLVNAAVTQWYEERPVSCLWSRAPASSTWADSPVLPRLQRFDR